MADVWTDTAVAAALDADAERRQHISYLRIEATKVAQATGWHLSEVSRIGIIFICEDNALVQFQPSSRAYQALVRLSEIVVAQGPGPQGRAGTTPS